jgi:hypothetical protein
MSNFKIGSNITLKKQQFTIVGIDNYSLVNFHGNIKNWNSITIANDHNRVSFSQTDEKYIFWEQVAIPATKIGILQEKYSLNWDFSGFAQLTFEGDKGASQPHAELVWFDRNTWSDILLLERFFDLTKDKFYFDTFFYKGALLNPDHIRIA